MRDIRNIHHYTIERLWASGCDFSSWYLPRRVVQLRRTDEDRGVERRRREYMYLGQTRKNRRLEKILASWPPLETMLDSE